MNIIKTDMWSTPVWQIDTGFDMAFNDALLAEVAAYRDTSPNPFDFNLWNCGSACVQELKNYTLKIVKESTYKYIAPNFTDFEFWHTRGWINCHQPGEGMPIHSHGGPKIAMTYYLKAEENAGDLLLIDPRGGVDWDSGNDGVNGTKFARIQPQPGRLVFFPGFVMHSVEANRSSQPRISLTSNMGTFDSNTIKTFIKTP
jgi:hypothetical protein